MTKVKYYKGNDSFKNDLILKAECDIKFNTVFSFFSYELKNIFEKCRSPPFINLIFKDFKLNGGKTMANMPKRNRSKDNPYILGYDENKKIYTVKFVDNKKVIHIVEISNTIYEAFDKFELEDISQIHKYRSHIEHLELTEETLNKRMFYSQLSVEEIVEQEILIEELKNAIEILSENQKRRIKMYYFEDMTLEEISKLENTTHQAISKSIHKAIEEIKKNLKN